MKTTQTIAFAALLATSLLAAEPLFTVKGDDPSWADVIKDGKIKPGVSFSKGPVLGSRIKVNHKLLEKQVGKTGPIPKDIGLHTQGSAGVSRKDFPNWTRWYQEDGNTQIFRLFKGEQNIRGGDGAKGTPGRVEIHSKLQDTSNSTWREWEATYTFIQPIGCIFQLFHNGKDSKGKALLWPFHIDMKNDGTVFFLRRNKVSGLEREIIIGENMLGKSLSIKVRANGTDYEVHQKEPLAEGPWKLVTKGSYAKATDDKISFRWGMYCGSKPGNTIPKDAMLFVSGVTIR